MVNSIGRLRELQAFANRLFSDRAELLLVQIWQRGQSEVKLTWNGRRIKVNFDFPPIPNRNLDWSACLDGDEEFGPYGRGPTRADAVADLLQHLLEGR